MKARFLHLADCHLGYRQYGSTVRQDDITKSFWWIMDKAVEEQVDFVVLAGDLFERRTIDPITLDHAVTGLQKLVDAGIPCVSVEGNHELAYHRDRIGWVNYLAERNLLVLLSPEFQDGEAVLSQYHERTGSWFDPVPGVRCHGIKYMGSSLPMALRSVARALDDHDDRGVDYTVFVAHTSINSVFPNDKSGIGEPELSELRPHVDYLALGHIHQPYDVDGWIYNPGSPDTNSFTEAEWPHRGYYMVDIDTDRSSPHKIELCTNPRREFIRLWFDVSEYESPVDLMSACRKFLDEKVQDVGKPDSVVELMLRGRFQFSKSSIQTEDIENELRSRFQPLIARVRNDAVSFEYASFVGEGQQERMSREQLRHKVFCDLIEGDSRYSHNTDGYATLLAEIMQLALAGADADTILSVMDDGHTRLTNPDSVI